MSGNSVTTGSWSSGLGGGIYNGDSLSLHTVSITGNTASGDGGGVYDYGWISKSGTTIAGNTPDDES
jgi:predicted outer membrane repeat protein